MTTHAQKPDFVFRAKRTSPLKIGRWGRQFSRLLPAELCASAVVMLDTACSEVFWRVLDTHCIRQFPPSLPLPVRQHVPSHFNWSLILEWRSVTGRCSQIWSLEYTAAVPPGVLEYFVNTLTLWFLPLFSNLSRVCIYIYIYIYIYRVAIKEIDTFNFVLKRNY